MAWQAMIIIINIFNFLFDLIFVVGMQFCAVSNNYSKHQKKFGTFQESSAVPNSFILIDEATHHSSASLAKNAMPTLLAISFFLGKGAPFPVLQFFCETAGFLLDKRQQNLQYVVVISGILRYTFLPIRKGLTWQHHTLFQEQDNFYPRCTLPLNAF